MRSVLLLLAVPALAHAQAPWLPASTLAWSYPDRQAESYTYELVVDGTVMGVVEGVTCQRRFFRPSTCTGRMPAAFDPPEQVPFRLALRARRGAGVASDPSAPVDQVRGSVLRAITITLPEGAAAVLTPDGVLIVIPEER